MFFRALGGMRWAGVAWSGSAAGDCRDDADFIAVFDRRLLIFKKSDVLFVDVNIDEPPHCPGVIEQALLDARIAGLQLGDGRADGPGVDLNEFLVIGQFAEWSRDLTFAAIITPGQWNGFRRRARTRIHASSA